MFYNKMNSIEKKLDNISKILLESELNEIAQTLQSNKKIIFKSFLSGISRGIGIAIGFTLLGAVVIYFLQKIVILNIPVISQYISDIVEIVEKIGG